MIEFYKIQDGEILDIKVAPDSYGRNADFFALDFKLEGEWFYIQQDVKPAIGDVFHPESGIYRNPQPFPSWLPTEGTTGWEAPTAHPDDPDNEYEWNEETVSWELVENG